MPPNFSGSGQHRDNGPRLPNLTAKTIESLRPSDRMQVLPDAGTPGLELYVTKTGVKTFSIRYTLADGTRRRLNLGRWPALSLADAREMALAAMAKVARGGDPSFDRKKERSEARSRQIRTMDDLAASLWESAPLTRVRASTLDYWKWLYSKHLQPRLGADRLTDVTKAQIRKTVRIVGTEAGPTTGNRAHALLRRLLNYAVEEALLPANPIAGMKQLFDEKSRARTLQDEELRAFWVGAERCKGQPGGDPDKPAGISRSMALALQLCAVTLQRGGEVIGMIRGEVDLKERHWILPASRTKGKREHLVPLSSMAVELILEAIELAELRLGRPLASSDPIFPSPRDPTKPVERLSLTRAMARLLETLPVSDASPHDLRRTGATLMASERIGILSEVISRVLNHVPPGLGVTAIYNRHAYVSEKRRALDLWARTLADIVGFGQPNNVVRLPTATVGG